MDWIKPEMLGTVAGASLAVTLVVAALKQIPGITGRKTQLVALIVSMTIAAVIGKWTTGVSVVASLLNGVVIFVSSMGIDSAINYGGKPNVK